jgi:DNA adenine methylase
MTLACKDAYLHITSSIDDGMPTVLTEQVLLAPGGTSIRATPFVKWAGGKNHLLRNLLPLVPTNLQNYYEPFLGGGALFFFILSKWAPFRAILSDTNEELILTYKVVKENPEELIRLLSRFQRQYSLSTSKEEYYYTVRGSKPSGRVERAARFIFLNKTCYNGLFRVNRRGEFNVPFGRYKSPRILNEAGISAASRALCANSSIRLVDYQKATETCDKGDFIYLDPPYDPVSETSGFTDYTVNGFGKEDQAKLAEWFTELVERGCTVLLSNSDTSLVRQLYRQYVVKSVDVSRPISCKGRKRTGFRELIVLGRRRVGLG